MKICPHCVVGIDLGTTYSSIARLLNNKNVELIKDNVTGSEWIPSVVCYKENGQIKVGNSAQIEERMNPKNVISDAKRMLGHKFNDEIIQTLSKKWLFDISKDPKTDEILINTSQGPKKPWEVCRDIIKYLVSLAKDQAAGHEITHAYVSVPANYNSKQRNETLKAAIEAGLKKVKLVSEPTAAVISYWFSNINSNSNSKKILIYDFGGGTLDVSLASVSNTSINIDAVEGEMLMGGRDLDNNLIEYYLKNKKLEKDINLYIRDTSSYGRKARNDLRLIREECERIKKLFSNESSSEQSIFPDIQSIDDPELMITLDTFEKLNKTIIDKLLDPVIRILRFTNVDISAIDEILLVGGSSSIPLVKTQLREYFNKEPFKDGEPRNAVVTGAAINARRLYVDNENCFKELVDLTYRDVCPLSLGTGIIGNKMCVIIPRNSTIPICKKESFVVLKNFQTSSTFNIYETENYSISNDSLIGSLTVNIPPLQAGEAKIILELSLDENCILVAKLSIENYDEPQYKSEKIIRQGFNLDSSFIASAIRSAEQELTKDKKLVSRRETKRKWNLLHENVILFINNYRNDVVKNKKVINETFDRILEIAKNEKKKVVSNKSQLNEMIEKYKQLFSDYNCDAPPHRKTNFLNSF